MKINEWVKATYKNEQYHVRGRIECNDGFNLSVQGNTGAYCSPRELSDYYSEMEIGFPSDEEPLIMKYAESPESPTETVYGYVPVSLIDKVIEKHGGMNVKKTLKNNSKK